MAFVAYCLNLRTRGDVTSMRLEVLESILDNFPAFVFVLDGEGFVAWQNLTSLTGTGMDICGRDITELIPLRNRESFNAALWPSLSAERPQFIETPIHTMRGTLLVAFERRRSPCGEYIVLTGHDLTEKIRRLKDETYRDQLTGLYNRAGFWAAAEHLAGEEWLVIACDLDGLKQVNDTQGRAAGDEFILNAVAVLKSVLRAGDVLARAGGDEFWLAMVCNDRADGHRLCERINNAAATAGISMSLGQATGPDNLNILLERADAEMYRNKAAKKVIAS